jgi:hypothetical protein
MALEPAPDAAVIEGWIPSGNNSFSESGWWGRVRSLGVRFGVYPYLPFFLKVLLGAGFGKNCLQITSSKRVRGKIRETQELGALFPVVRLPPLLRELPSVLRRVLRAL